MILNVIRVYTSVCTYFHYACLISIAYVPKSTEHSQFIFFTISHSTISLEGEDFLFFDNNLYRCGKFDVLQNIGTYSVETSVSGFTRKSADHYNDLSNYFRGSRSIECDPL